MGNKKIKMNNTKQNKAANQKKQTKTTSTGKKGRSEDGHSRRFEELSEAIALGISAVGTPGVDIHRWSSEYSQQDTALAKPFEIVTADWGSSVPDPGDQIKGSQFLTILKRVPECASIVYFQNSANALKLYQVSTVRNDGTVGTTQDFLAGNVLRAASEQRVKTIYADSVGNFAPHGSRLYAGSVQGSPSRLLWCDLSDVYTMDMASIPGCSLNVVVERYNEDGFVENAATIPVVLAPAVPQTVTIKAAGSVAGYYGFRLANRTTTDAEFTMTTLQIQGASSCFGHRPLPGFNSNILRQQGVRVMGATLMYTNTANFLDLGGSISSVQYGEQDDWFDLIVANTQTVIQSKAGSDTRTIREGQHGFLKPTQPSDFLFKSWVEINEAGVLVDSNYPLDNQGAFIAMCGNVSSQDGAQGYFTIAFALEYLSTDTWADRGVSEFPPEVYAHALNHLKRIPQFHSNPVHLKDIWNSIKNAARKVGGFLIRNGPAILSGIEKGMALL